MGPDGYLKHIAKCKQAVQDPDHRQPERHDQRRLDRLREADGAGRRGRAGAEHLLHRRPTRTAPASRWSSSTCDLVRAVKAR